MSHNEAMKAAGFTPGQLSRWHKPGPPAPITQYRGLGVVLSIADEDAGRRVNRRELVARRWASGHGIPCPDVIAYDPGGWWLLGRFLEPLPQEGPDYVRSAMAAADAIASSPAPVLDDDPTSWRGQRRTALARAVRLTASGVWIPRLIRARRSYEALTETSFSHGDYYRRNVLCVSGGVSAVDWEFAGDAPAMTDHLRLWSTLRAVEDREMALTHILNASLPLRHISVVARWLVHRLVAENLSAPRGQRNSDDLTHAQQMVGEYARLVDTGSLPSAD